MTLFTEPNLTSGIDDAIVSTAQSVVMFPIMILVFVYGVILLGGFANQKRRTGSGDFWFWNVLGSVTTFVVTLIFTLTAGIINGTVLGIIIGITILSALAYYISSVKGEV